MSQDELKRAAARVAVEREVRSGMKVGLGSGSTVAFVLETLGDALREGRLSGIVGVSTSDATTEQARSLNIPLADLHEVGSLDVAIDGADEIDPALDVIKGLGGALLREKMIAQATDRFVVVADESKRVTRLGTRSPLPVEVVPFGWRVHLPFLTALGARPRLRERDGSPYRTDNGNYILDCYFEGENGMEDPSILEWQLLARAGIVDHGLFLDMADVAYVAGAHGVQTLSRDS